MLCTGIEEFLIADWSSPFGKVVVFGVLCNRETHITECHSS